MLLILVLRRAQVTQIIERTAQKVGGYTYTTTSGRPNGTWDNEMGYGLIDADAAVRMAVTKYLQNYFNTASSTHKAFYIKAGFDVRPYPSSTGNYTADPTTGIITIQASKSIELEPGTILEGPVDVKIQSVGSCTTW